MNGLTDEQMNEILEHIYGNRKLDAVACYKKATGESLLNSKTFIEELTERMKIESPDQFRPETNIGCGTAVLLIFLLGFSLPKSVFATCAFWIANL